MTEDREAFLERWSRLKQEQAEEKPVVPEEKKEEPEAALPPVEELKPDSDFRPFMAAKVDHETRRSALKKLFADAHFNVPDPFEAYSEDYTRGEPIPMEMLKTLNQAKKLLFDEPDQAQAAKSAPSPPSGSAAPESPQAEIPPPEAKDVAGKQDA